MSRPHATGCRGCGGPIEAGPIDFKNCAACRERNATRRARIRSGIKSAPPAGIGQRHMATGNELVDDCFTRADLLAYREQAATVHRPTYVQRARVSA